jgi:hypothetical protein
MSYLRCPDCVALWTDVKYSWEEDGHDFGKRRPIYGIVLDYRYW